MFSILGKKELLGPLFWIIPAIANIQGLTDRAPTTFIYWAIFIIIMVGSVFAIGSFVRFLINYFRSPRLPYG